MFERDYLMRFFELFIQAIRRSWTRAKGKDDPLGAASMLEEAIGQATEIDGGILLSLEPESMASVISVSGTDPRVTEYVARSLMLSADYRRQAGDDALADLRLAQAQALAEAYGFELSTPEDIVAQAAEQEGDWWDDGTTGT